MKMKAVFTAGVFAAGLALAFAGQAFAQNKPIVGLVTKTDTNPYFVKMKQGAQQEANKLGLELRSFSGKYDGDTASQIDAIESLVAAGAKGILITPSDPAALYDTIQRARQNGVLVIALDTPFPTPGAVDATYATDNFAAGQKVGEWAKDTLGAKAQNAKIAMLDLSPAGVSVDVLRDQGFLKGFGVDIKNPDKIGDETDSRIVGHDVTRGEPAGGQTAMENLLQKNPEINVVYTINEPAAAGAYQALKEAGLADKVKNGQILIVSIDGSCPGVQNVKEGIIGATSMQFPLKMAADGVEAVANYAKTGQKPNLNGKSFIDTGVDLVTGKPVKGLTSIPPQEGLKLCWG